MYPGAVACICVLLCLRNRQVLPLRAIVEKLYMYGEMHRFPVILRLSIIIPPMYAPVV